MTQDDKRLPRRALISVSDKTGLLELAQALQTHQVDILSTGGTLQFLQDNQIPARSVSDVTEFPEIMNGRVKTMHPRLMGGILGRRGIDEAVAEAHGIPWIDLVVCNLYPFEQTVQDPRCTLSDAVEQIDVGGPTMIRSAAKNFAWVTVLSRPSDYADIIQQLNQGGIDFETRRKLACTAFALTARYDAAITQFLNPDLFPETLIHSYEKTTTLRYGENPHQQAAVYQDRHTADSLLTARVYQGKELSYNNLVDAQAALDCLTGLTEPACSVIKHAIPCGIATAGSIHQAFDYAFQADSKSAFGGVIALNRLCDGALAEQITAYFMEIVIAPGFTEEALAVFARKPDLRVLHAPSAEPAAMRSKPLSGGLLLQTADLVQVAAEDLKIVTKIAPSPLQIRQLLFAWHCVRHVKSNAIVIANEHVTLGMSGGQTSRVDAVEMAIKKADQKALGAALASDAFFPFRDSLDHIATAGITAVIQPGGSKRDSEVIDACNDHGIAMVFTGIRCFYH